MLNREEVEKLAELARLDLNEEEAASLAADFDAILEYVSEIQSVAAEAQALEVGEHYNVMRQDGDAHAPGEYSEALLAEAPKREGNYIKVKKILQND